MSDWTDIDNKMLDPEWYVNDGYHSVFARLRQEDPVHFTHDTVYGKDYWLLTRYDDVRDYLADFRTFSSRWETRIPRNPKRYTPEERFEYGFYADLTRIDPPIHTLYRRPLNKFFSAPAIGKHTDRIERIMDEIIDDVAGLGECDLVEQVAGQLPLRVLLGLLGVPEEDWDILRDAVWRWLAPGNPKYTIDNDPEKTSLIGQQQLLEYCEKLALARRAEPQDDFATLIANLTIDGDLLSVYELRTYIKILIGAGLETTRNAGAAGLWLFMTHPEQRELLMSDPTRINAAIDEVLRWVTPAKSRFRVATKDLELHGKRIKEGDWVIGSLVSANRDETRFENPNKFDITRAPVPHLSFAHGEHLCLGRMLARLELKTMLLKVLSAFPDMQPTAEPTWLPDVTTTGFTSLPVTYTPRTPALVSEPRR